MAKRVEFKTVPTLRLTAALSLLAGTPVALAQSVPGLQNDPIGGATTENQDAPGQNPDSGVNMGEYEQIELHFRDEDISTALQLLAMQAERSIVTTNNVSGTVTANLYGVSFFEALDSILLYNGFGYIEQGGTIFVMPREDILAWEQSQRVAESAVIRLTYLNAVDAAQFAQGALSADGTITTNGVTGEFTLTDSAPSGRDSYAHGSVMVVHDYPENIDEVRAIVAELDTKPVSVLVEATILQKSISDAYGYGVDFTILSDLDFLEFVDGPLSAAQTLINGGSESTTGDGGGDGDGGDVGASTVVPADGEGTAVTSTVGNTPGRGGFKVGVVNDDVAVFVRLLDEMGDTTIISNPKLLTLNRQAASVQVGRRVGYLSTTTTDTTTQQTVEFLDTGTQLYVRPFVGNQNNIRLEIQPEVSQPIIREVADSNGAQLTIPDEDTSRLSTNVEVQDGQTVVLGGLFTERTTTNRRQIPVLGDVPILGLAFRGEDNSVDRAEIIFMITPTVVEDESMADAGVRALEQVDFARVGAREGLLGWSRERRAGQLLVDAQKLAAEDKTRAALDKIGRAMALQPGMTDAVLLRENLLREATVWPSRSGMEDVINEETMARVDMFREAIMAAKTAEQEQAAADSYSGADEGFRSWSDGSFEGDGDAFVNETWDEGDFESFDSGFEGDDFDQGGFEQDNFDQDNFEQDHFDQNDFDQDSFNDSGFDTEGFDSGDSFEGSRRTGNDAASFEQDDLSDLSGEALDERIANTGRGELDGFERQVLNDWDRSFGAGGESNGAQSQPFTGDNEAGQDISLGGSIDEQFQIRSQYLSLTTNEAQRAIERFAEDFARFPTMSELRSAPIASRAGSFGVLVDGGYIDAAPVNPFFAAGQASRVGVVGSGSAFEYDEQTGTMVAGEGDFASVWESGQVVTIDSARMLAMIERNVQDVIDTYRELTGTYPSLAELQASPWDEVYGDSFGALIDEGLLTSAPANPFFQGERASSVGAPGSEAAWYYNENTFKVSANRSQFAGVSENSVQDD